LRSVIKHARETEESAVAPFERLLIKTNESSKITSESSCGSGNAANQNVALKR
jgi:hypothetical protein